MLVPSPVDFKPDIEYFKRGSTEYRLVSHTRDVYEYNKLKPDALDGEAGSSLRAGGVPDGYVVLTETGALKYPPISYVVLDQLIARDAPFLDSSLNVPLVKRTFEFYENASRALRALDRVFVSPDNSSVEVITGGRRWRLELAAPVRITDIAIGEWYAFVDVRILERSWTHVELKIDEVEGEAYLYDHFGLGRVAEIPCRRIIDLATMEDILAKVSEQKRKESHLRVSVSRLSKTQNTDTTRTLHPAAALAGVNDAPAAAVSTEKTAVSARATATLSREVLDILHTEQKRQDEGSRDLGRLHFVSEETGQDGLLVRRFEAPYGKETVTFTSMQNGTITKTEVAMHGIMFPATELLPDWEERIEKKRREVGKFFFDSPHDDLNAAKEEVVRRAREQATLKKILSYLSMSTTEQGAVSWRIEELQNETRERYGDVFTPSL